MGSVARVALIHSRWLDKRAVGSQGPQLPTLVAPSEAIKKTGVVWIYVVLKKGSSSDKHVYVGKTKHDIFTRFWQHYKGVGTTHDSVKLTKALQSGQLHHFTIYGLEQVHMFKEHCMLSSDQFARLVQKREQFWMNRLDTIKNGLNTRRAIRLKHHRCIEQNRQYGSREYTLKMAHLQKLWVSKGGLSPEFFVSFKLKKLLSYISMLVHAKRPSNSFNLRQVLEQVVMSRARYILQHLLVHNTVSPKTHVLTFPYSKELWQHIPLHHILNDKHSKRMLPTETAVQDVKFTIRYAYGSNSKLEMCNYTEVARNTSVDEVACICNTAPYNRFIDPNHGHVVTGDVNVVKHLPQLHTVMKYGSKFRMAYLMSDTSCVKLIGKSLRAVISEYSHKEGVQSVVFLAWYLHVMDRVRHYTYMHSDTPIAHDNDQPDDMPPQRIVKAQLRRVQNHFVIGFADKAEKCFTLTCKQWYIHKIRGSFSGTEFELVANANLQSWSAKVTSHLQKWKVAPDQVLTAEHTHLPCIDYPTFFGVLKLHKTPIALRGVTSVQGTPTCALSRLLVQALTKVADVVDTMWSQLGVRIGIHTPQGSWITSNSSQISPRLATILKEPMCRGRPAYILDFTSMYTKFSIADIKAKMRCLISLAYEYQSGAHVLTDLDGEGLHLAKPCSGYTNRIEVQYSRNRSKGILPINRTIWVKNSARISHADKSRHIRFDTEALSKMIDFLLDNSFVQFRGSTYQQIQGLPMGTPCAPQLANLYCGYYELMYMTRQCQAFIAKTHNHLQREVLVSVFN
jgi:hypothetical protein